MNTVLVVRLRYAPTKMFSLLTKPRTRIKIDDGLLLQTDRTGNVPVTCHMISDVLGYNKVCAGLVLHCEMSQTSVQTSGSNLDSPVV